MAFEDLRQYIQALEKLGDAQPIEQEVDWNLEVGAIIRRCYDLRAPAPFFQKIKDYPRGYRVFGAPASFSSLRSPWARVAVAFGMSPDATFQDIVDFYIDRREKRVKPVTVSSGPCKQNILLGDDIDLLKFPAPFIHEGDGGRYIGTWHTVVTRDPETGWTNWGLYRMMVHDRRTMGALIQPIQHAGFHFFQKYEPRSQPMEFAIAIGTEPVTTILSGNRMPPGVDEAEIVGGIRGEAVPLVRCETADLYVPATSEIVIEGVVAPHERKLEGPFGEYTGYRAAEQAPRPVWHVRAITHRNDPILPVVNTGVPVIEEGTMICTIKSAEILHFLRGQRFPVKAVYSPPQSAGHFIIISTKVPFPNYVHHLANAVWGHTGWGRSAWFLMIVEDDIDVTDMEQVTWALFTRCHPDRGIFKHPHAPAPALIPWLSAYERKHHQGAWVLFDCTWPKDWPAEDVPFKIAFDTAYPTEIQEKVLQNWARYGYKSEK